ncbi:MAG TPA: hypothetical protein VK165_11075 [Azonexus sp.]|nr:hypothetical protein [Azonexus sp.]
MTETTSISIATSIIDAATTSSKQLSPRERRLLTVLAERGKTSRHDLDRLAGYENTPDGVLHLRRRHGFELPMEKQPLLDRDGRTVRIGYYSLSESDRMKFAALEAV